MSAFTNRKDITMQRSDATSHSDDSMTSDLLRAIAHSAHQTAVNTEQENVYSEMGVLDREPGQFHMKNFPFVGSERYLVRRTGDGGQFSLTTTATLIVPASEARIGGLIVNSSTTSVLLFLTNDITGTTGVPLATAPVIFLPVGGSGWNFLLGRNLWCGNVQAAASTGTATVTVALI